jgi:host factor-I protein
MTIHDNEPKPGQRTPMEKLAQNIQEAFLNNARKDKTFLTIYLMSGVKLSGRIKSFDKYSVVLETNNQEQLIFKHAISTVVVSSPQHPLEPPPAVMLRPRNPSRINSTFAGV